jgi:hypothetical protein
MRKHRRWLTIPVALGLVALIGIGLRAGRADDPKRLTAADVVKLWKPMPDGTEDFQQFVASPKESPGLAAATFRVVAHPSRPSGTITPTCAGSGTNAYEPKRLLMSGKTGAKGSYVVSDRADAKGGGC